MLVPVEDGEALPQGRRLPPGARWRRLRIWWGLWSLHVGWPPLGLPIVE